MSLSSITPSLSASKTIVIWAVLVIESLAVITVITASPLAIAVTIPFWLTVTILSSLDFQLMVSETLVGYILAISVSVSPTTICREDGVSETLSIGT